MAKIEDIFSLLPNKYMGSIVTFTRENSNLSIDFGVENSKAIMELKCFLFNLEEKKYTDSSFSQYIFWTKIVISFLSQFRYPFNSFLQIDEDFINSFRSYLQNKGYRIIRTNGQDSYYIAAFSVLNKYLMNILDERVGFERDTWDLSTMNLSPSRINPSATNNRFHFSNLDNESNKQLIKDFTKRIILQSNLALSTINAKYYSILEFILFLGEQNIQSVNRTICENYINYRNSKGLLENSFNFHLSAISEFLDYCVSKKYFAN